MTVPSLSASLAAAAALSGAFWAKAGRATDMAATAQLATSQCLEFLTKFLPGFLLGLFIIATLQRRHLSVKLGLIGGYGFPPLFEHLVQERHTEARDRRS